MREENSFFKQTIHRVFFFMVGYLRKKRIFAFLFKSIFMNER